MFSVHSPYNLGHLILGGLGLLVYQSYFGPKTYARGVAIIYAVFIVMGLIDGLDTTFGLVPLYGADVVLHLLLAAVAAYFGFMHRDTVSTDRS